MAGRYTLVVSGDDRTQTGTAAFHIAKWSEPSSAIGEAFWKVVATSPTKVDAMTILGDLRNSGADVQTA